MKGRLHPLQSARTMSISAIASVALTAVVTVVLLAFAWAYYSAESTKRMEQLRHQLATSADQLAVAVALPAWNFDDSQILAIMRSSLNARDLYGSEVAATANRRNYILMRGADGSVVQADALPPGPDLLVESRVIHVAGQDIGTLKMVATSRFVQEDLRERRFAIIGVILVLDLALVLVLYVLLWYLILRPLKALGHYAVQVQDGQGNVIPPKRDMFVGELKVVNTAIHEMVTLLDRRYRAMRASEERLSIATHAANIGIWDWDIATNRLVWDEEMIRQYGLRQKPGMDMMATWRASIHPDDCAAVFEKIERAVRGEAQFASEFRVVRADGSVRHVKADSQTFRDEHGAASRMVGVSYDITEAKQAEEELRRHRNHLEELVEERTAALSVAVTEAEAASRAKSVFLATMSHELRTPLNSVIGFSRLMSGSQHMAEEDKRNLSIIHRSGQHLLTLINDILELSKIEAGRVTMQSGVVDPEELVGEVLDMVSARANQARIALSSVCEGLPPAINVDGAKLRQVLLNLLSNAVKFAEHGSVMLKVQGTPMGARRVALRFAVQDTGVGIAREDQERIFEPFVQAVGPGAKDGTGLGLAISREFVRLLGGTLRVQSELGEGASFSFTIEAEISEEAPAPRESAPAVVAPPRHGKRVLVIDDNEDGRRLLSSVLAPLGFDMIEATDGQAGLEAVEAASPDLVFMDWRMPGLDGLEATRRLRANQRIAQPPVVMLTASAFEEQKQEALAAGADAFLRKPVEQDELFDILERQLGIQLRRRSDLPGAPPPAPVTSESLRALPDSTRQALRASLQELNVTRATQILVPLRAGHGALVEGIAHMMERHQYPQLCELIDAAAERA